MFTEATLRPAENGELPPASKNVRLPAASALIGLHKGSACASRDAHAGVLVLIFGGLLRKRGILGPLATVAELPVVASVFGGALIEIAFATIVIARTRCDPKNE